MKVRSDNFLLAFFLILFGFTGVTPASAQDENDPSVNESKDLNQSPDLISNDEKAQVTDHERAYKIKDSLHTHSSVTAGQKTKSAYPAKPSSNKEEDALSFNFLYYIIQKFKISDLIDD